MPTQAGGAIGEEHDAVGPQIVGAAVPEGEDLEEAAPGAGGSAERACKVQHREH
jgi:hypothetical protein